jgi:integrase
MHEDARALWGIISRHIRPRWGNVQLSGVTHAEVQRWLTRLELAPASVRKVHRVLSMILAYAVKDGRLAINAAAGVSLPRVRQTERRYLTHQQVAELAESCGEPYRLVVLFLAYTGLRWGEMAALRVGRVDFLRRRVLVAESVTPVRGVMTFGPTKGHERREVSLPRSWSMIWRAALPASPLMILSSPAYAATRCAPRYSSEQRSTSDASGPALLDSLPTSCAIRPHR